MSDLAAVEACRTVIDGQFVRLRPLQVEDAERTLAWRLSPRAALLNRGAQTVDEQRAWIAGRPARELNYIIETRAGLPVGMLSLVDIDLVNRRAEPARFLLGEEEAVKGLPAAAESMLLLYGVAFDRLHLARVHGAVVEDNAPMLRWHLYLGMKEEGRLRQHLLMNGRLQDVVCIGLLEPEFRRATLPRLKALIAMAARGSS
jgi:RimJ/RimL family protein N-acetyltransferase